MEQGQSVSIKNYFVAEAAPNAIRYISSSAV